jgi:hypothetical protein
MNEPEILWIKNHLMKIKFNHKFYDISPFEFSAAYLQYCITNEKFIINNNRLAISNFISFIIQESNHNIDTRRINSNYKSDLKKSIVKVKYSNKNKLVMNSNIIGTYNIDISYINNYANIIYSLLNNDSTIFFDMKEKNEINDIFDYRIFDNKNPIKLKPAVILEKFEINNNKYILLGYPDMIKMKDFYYRENNDNDKYFFESNNFQQILNDQNNQKDYLINFLNFFYYNNDKNNFNSHNLWKFSTLGINLNEKTKYISENVDFIKDNYDFFNIIKNFLNEKMEESFNKINTNIKYNFILYYIDSNNYLKNIVEHFTKLNNTHTKILEKVYIIINNKMNNLINNNFLINKNNILNNNFIKNNFLIYIKQGGAFTIHLEYNNPFKNIYYYNYVYQKIIFFQDLIDYTKMYSYQNEPILSIYNPKTFLYINEKFEDKLNDNFTNDINNLVKYKNNFNNQNGGFKVLQSKHTKVLLFNIKMNKEIIAILENNNKFYYLNIFSNLNIYKNNSNEFKNLIKEINYNNLLYNSNNIKTYYINNDIIYPYRFECFELTNENKFFYYEFKLLKKNINLQNNKLKNSFILNDILKSLPFFSFQIFNKDYKEFYNNLKFFYQLDNSKKLIINNYLQYYSDDLCNISNKDSNIEINYNNEYFFKVDYLKNKCVGFLFRKEKINKNENKKNDKNINNLISFNNDNIEIFQNVLNIIKNIIVYQLFKIGNDLYNNFFGEYKFY